MFVGLIGSVCSGKTSFARILQLFYKFKIINLVELFELRDKIDIKEYIAKANCKSPLEQELESKEENVIKEEEEEVKEIERYFCKDYYLKEDCKEDVDKIICIAIEVMKEDWKSNYVIYPIPSMDQIKAISFRHTYIMYEIEAPIVSRYKWFQKKYSDDVSFEEFASIDDSLKFETDYFSCKDEERGGKVRRCFKNSGSVEELMAKVLKYDFNNYELVRPNWDDYFMRIAHVAATRSNCMKRSVGAVIVNPDKQIVATGYNGTTFGFPNCYEGGCDRCNNTKVKQGEKLDLCICIHAEENAILIAGRVQTKGCSIYVTAYPCGLCAKFLLQSGIKHVYYDSEYKSDIAKLLFDKCGITVKRVQPFLSPAKT